MARRRRSEPDQRQTPEHVMIGSDDGPSSPPREDGEPAEAEKLLLDLLIDMAMRASRIG